MSGWLSICAGVEVPVRMRTSKEEVRRSARGLRGACAALL